MAKCKICGSEFQGESAYCDNCLKENKNYSSESYLDNLLKSMVNQPSTNQNVNINKKIAAKSDNTNEKLEIENKDEQEDNNLENRKYTSDEQEQIKDDIEDILAPGKEYQDILALEEDSNIDESVDEDNNFNNESLDDILSLHDDFNEESNENNYENSSEDIKEDIVSLHDNSEEAPDKGIKEDIVSLHDNSEEALGKGAKEDIAGLHDNSEDDSSQGMNSDILSLHDDSNVDAIGDDGRLDIQDDLPEEDDNTSASDFESMNEADDDLVALLGMITGLEESSNGSNKEDVFALEEKEDDWAHDQLKTTSNDKTKSSKSKDALNDIAASPSKSKDALNDIAASSAKSKDTLNDIAAPSAKSKDTLNNIDTSLAKDQDNNDMLNDILSIDNLFGDEPIQSTADKNPGDLGEVFSDSLSAINVLNDQDKNEDFNNDDISLLSQTENREDVKKKKWAKIFGSGKNGGKEMEEVKEKPKKKEKVKKSKKKKKEKLKDKAVAASKNNSNQEEEQDNKKAVKGKQEKKVKDKKAAKAKKENAKKKNAVKNPNSIVKEVMEEEDTGKISKAGTSLTFIFCGLIAIFIIVGTNLYTYSLNMSKAKSDFERQRYTDAYNDIYGYKVKTSDMELYDKIMTVMYVNKQLNSFYNYSSLSKQPEALDSLLKGLARYEEVIDKAVSLGIKEDMDSLKSQIIVELEDKYNIKEKEALAIIYTEGKDEYTQHVLNAVAKNTN